MPEGPECRLTVDYLIKVLQGRTIKDWIFSGGKYTDSSPEGFQEFDMALPLTVTEVSCKGKFIYFKLVNNSGNNFYIMHSLMMTGRWQKKYDEYCKWFVELDTGTTLWFSDSRGFGSLKFTTIEEVLNSKLQLLGPDIMRSEFRLPLFKELIKKYTNRNITSFLMNQEVISGCGNYIKAEVLYYSKISPFRKSGSLIIEKLNYFMRLYVLFQGYHIIILGSQIKNLKIVILIILVKL